MKQTRMIALILALALVVGGVVYATAGSAADSLVSLSYIQSTFMHQMRTAQEAVVTQAQQAALAQVQTRYDAQAALLEDAWAEDVAGQIYAEVSAQVRAAGVEAAVADMVTMTVYRDEVITGAPGCGIIFLSGAGQIAGPSGSEVINVTAGGVRAPGLEIRTEIYYMIAADDGSGIQVTSDSAQVLLSGDYHIDGRYEAQYTDYADALKSLGLFVGSNQGYELERAPTRQEALIMLIRLLGEESDALAFTGTSHFTDLTGWGDGQKYVNYGVHMGYTNGDGPTTFSQYRAADMWMYTTFVLRALGYDDSIGDFVWNATSIELAQSIGLLTEQEARDMQSGAFLRDHVVKLSYNALFATLKSGEMSLGEKLIADGVMTQAQLDAAQQTIK